MKILITGAHFTPAVAVIEQLKKRQGIEIVYVGRKTTLEGDSSQSVESQILPKLGVKFIPIIAGRLQRKFTIFTIPALLKIPIGFIQAFFIILKEQPDIILSFGGYVAVPVVISGWLWSVPIVVHEQTLVLGLANKITSFLADKICLGFAQNNFGKLKNVVVTGNPIRGEILNPQTSLPSEYEEIFKIAKRDNLPVILITGGNQGSHILNLAVEESLEKLLNIACVIHQTGDSKFQDFERLTKIQNPRFLAKKWIGEEIGGVLSKVDLVVSRAGINTLTESAYLAKVALVVPLPFLYQDEQNVNAHFFESSGLVKILPQSKLNNESLIFNIKDMLKNLDKWNLQAKTNKDIIIPDGAKRLALELQLTFTNSHQPT